MRLPAQLLSDLHEACDRYKIQTLSQFCTIAVRKFNHVGDVAKLERFQMATCDTNPTIRLDQNLIGDKTPDQLRKVFMWYLEDLKSKTRPQAPVSVKSEQEAIKKGNAYAKQAIERALNNY